LENTHALSGYYSPFKPLSSQLGESPNEDFSRKIKQIGEISYSPKYKTEEMRHLKVLIYLFFLLKQINKHFFF